MVNSLSFDKNHHSYVLIERKINRNTNEVVDLTTIMAILVFHFEKEETSFVFGIHYISGKWKELEIIILIVFEYL